MKKTLWKPVSLVFLGLYLSGCEHQVSLLTPEGIVAGSGTLAIGDNDTTHASFVIGQTKYQGRWEAKKIDESRAIAAHYGFASHQYRKYISGNANNYLHQGEATLTSADGESLKCDIRFRAASGRAICHSGSENFDFVIKG